MCKVPIPDNLRSLSLWELGLQYFDLVEGALQQILLHDNSSISIHPVIKSVEPPLENMIWSDSRILIPVLFNFYHALELTLKGFIIKGSHKKAADHEHDIELVLANFTKKFPSEIELIKLLNKYILKKQLPAPLNEVFKKNNISPKSFYDFFRYPFDKKESSIRNHLDIKYMNSSGIPFIENLLNDCKRIRSLSVTLGKSLI